MNTKDTTQSKEVLNITPGKWGYDDGHLFKEADDGHSLGSIAHIYETYPEMGGLGGHNAKAICTAVNETYGKGLNPAAMDELYKALQNMYNLAEEMGMIMTSDQWTERFRNKFNPIMTATETALQNSKI